MDHDEKVENASPSCLFYLFADRLIPTERRWHLVMGEIAVPVPGSNALVALGHLEQLLLAVAIWHLAATGVIGLERDMSLGRSPFRLVPATAPGDVPGLEGQLVAAVPAGGASLRDVVMRRWAAEHPMALNAIVVEAQTEALSLDLIDRPETPNLAPGLLGYRRFPTVSVHKNRLYSQRKPFNVMAAQWSQVAEPGGLGTDLLNACRKVLFDARPSLFTRSWTSLP